jgi:hypothetical protein
MLAARCWVAIGCGVQGGQEARCGTQDARLTARRRFFVDCPSIRLHLGNIQQGSPAGIGGPCWCDGPT